MSMYRLFSEQSKRRKQIGTNKDLGLLVHMDVVGYYAFLGEVTRC